MSSLAMLVTKQFCGWTLPTSFLFSPGQDSYLKSNVLTESVGMNHSHIDSVPQGHMDIFHKQEPVSTPSPKVMEKEGKAQISCH